MATQGIETPVEVATASEAAPPPEAFEGSAGAPSSTTTPPAPTRRWRWRTVLAIPAAAAISLAVHYFLPGQHPPSDTRYYPSLLLAVLALAVVAAIVQAFWNPLRRQMRDKAP